MSGVASVGRVRALAAVAAFALCAAASSVASAAVQFSGSYQVNALSSDPGLVVHTAKLADPLNFMLNAPGDTFTVDLFDIWTDETVANGQDDFAPAGISVDFSFVTPLSSGSVTGTTMAGTILIASGGVLSWDGPTIIDFGNGGKLWVSLSDEIFNVGPGLDLTPGREHGATVKAKFKLKDVAVVPLPPTLALLMAALAGFGLLHRRSRLA